MTPSNAVARGGSADAGAGIAGAVLFLAGFALLATPPSPSDSGAEVVEYLADRRSSVFAAALAVGAGSVLFLWFLTALGAWLAPPEQPSPAWAAILAGFGGALLVLGALAVLAGLALHIESPAEAALALVGFDVYNALLTIAGFLFAASVLAAVIAGARHGTLPRSVRAAGLVVALLQLATLPGLFVEKGFLAAGAEMALLAFWALAAWFIAVAVVMRRRPGSAPS